MKAARNRERAPQSEGRHPASGRRLPIGAEVMPRGGVHFRVWAPRSGRVEVVLEDGSGATARSVELTPEAPGYFAAPVADAAAGTLYRFRLDGGEQRLPDPASRFQPEGVHGPSMVVDARSFPWTDRDWRGLDRRGQVIYEMHIGTFTPEGSWAAAARELGELAALGVTVLEILPVAEFPGRFGWGYDGVDLFAPTRLYGDPDDFRRFVDRAHDAGLGVILDVVYNHLGPDGNYLKQFSPDYFTDRYENEWGEAVNFDGPDAGPVREFVLSNARYWIDEFHLDGLRLDATQQMFDSSPEHIVAAIARTVHEAATPGRSTLVIAENEPQRVRLVRPPAEGGYGVDTVWNEDFHHSAMVALTGHREGYYSSHFGNPQEFVSAAKWGFLYQGQRYKWQKQRRGTPTFGVEPAAFVAYLQNHDQVANTPRGLRCHALTSPGRYRAMTALLLLGPSTPMLFQGQEFAASAPFPYFADHRPDLEADIRRGRRGFLKQFRSLATPEMAPNIPDPGNIATFTGAKLDRAERESHREIYALHRDLLRLRRQDPVFRAQRLGGVDGAVLGPEAFVLRFFGAAGDDRLLLVNLGRDLHLDPAPEPLLAPPEDADWAPLWSSEDPRYGGNGTPPLDSEENWRLPGRAAVALAPRGREEPAAERDRGMRR